MTLPPAETLQADDTPTGAAAAYALAAFLFLAGAVIGGVVAFACLRGLNPFH